MCEHSEDPIDRGWRVAMEREEAGCPDPSIVTHYALLGPDVSNEREKNSAFYAKEVRDHMLESCCDYCVVELMLVWKQTSYSPSKWCHDHIDIVLEFNDVPEDSTYGVALRRLMKKYEIIAEFIKKHVKS